MCCCLAAAGPGAYVMPCHDDNLNQGASSYCFFTVGPDIKSPLGFWHLKWDPYENVEPSTGGGCDGLLSDWKCDGLEHSIGGAKGMLLGLLVGPMKWYWLGYGGDLDVSDSDTTEDE